MANYKAHTTVNLIFFLPLALGVIYFFISKEMSHLVIFGGCFVYGTLFMNPDLDMANKIKLFSIRGLLTLPFRTYAYLFRHRGLSHSFILGTATRVGWLFGHFLLFAYLFYHFSPTIDTFMHYLDQYRTEIIYACSALFIADSGHLLIDRLSSK